MWPPLFFSLISLSAAASRHLAFGRLAMAGWLALFEFTSAAPARRRRQPQKPAREPCSDWPEALVPTGSGRTPIPPRLA